jgi:hypothetical protein
MKANQANQEISNLGKDNVSKKPLDAAKNKLSLWGLFLFPEDGITAVPPC